MPSEGIQIRVKRDALSPDLRAKAARVADLTPVMEAMGLQVVSITTRAFNDPSLRPSPWPARRNTEMRDTRDKAGRLKPRVFNTVTQKFSNALLKLTGALYQSIRISGLTKTTVRVGSDRKYAAIHQLGGTIRAKGGKSLVFTVNGVTIFAKKVKIPARPFFPFKPDGSMTELAAGKVAKVAERKIDALLRST